MIKSLNVYLDVLAKTDENVNYEINETSRVNIKILLSEKAIEIALDKTNQNSNKQVFPSGKIVFNKIPLVICYYYISQRQHMINMLIKSLIVMID